MTRRHRRRHDHGGEQENEERWLLTYADMITLLMALFMVLFSISSTNVSKLKQLQASLQDAFSGRVLPGGQALEASGTDDAVRQSLASTPKVSVADTAAAGKDALRGQAAGGARLNANAIEQQAFEALKREVDAQARRMHLSGKVSTRITPRGLVIDILSDNLLFATGRAVVRPSGVRLLSSIAPLLRRESRHHIIVEGHTDNVPISGQYPSNWELSTARASAVVRVLLTRRLPAHRLEASGRAQLDPVASNATAPGRAHNRRVEVLLPRTATIQGPGSSP